MYVVYVSICLYGCVVDTLGEAAAGDDDGDEEEEEEEE